MIFEIEGSDLVGKTTIAEKLSKKYNIPIMKFSENPLDPYKPDFSFVALGYCLGYAETMRSIKKNFISDRLFISNYIYERLLTYRRTAVTDKILDDFYSKFNIKTLILTLDDGEIKKRFKTRGDEFFKLNFILDANADYKRVFKKMKKKFPTKFFDNLEEFEKEIQTCIQ